MSVVSFMTQVYDDASVQQIILAAAIVPEPAARAILVELAHNGGRGSRSHPGVRYDRPQETHEDAGAAMSICTIQLPTTRRPAKVLKIGRSAVRPRPWPQNHCRSEA